MALEVGTGAGGGRPPTTPPTGYIKPTIDWKNLLNAYRKRKQGKPVELTTIQPNKPIPWGEMYRGWKRGQEWAVTPDEADKPITKREYDYLVDERIKRTPQAVLTDLRRTADDFTRLGYVRDPEQFIRMEVGDWVGQDVGLSRDLAHTASDRTTPGVRGGLAPITQTAPIKAEWLPTIWKQWSEPTEKPSPGYIPPKPMAEIMAEGEPALEPSPRQIAGAGPVGDYLQKAWKRATAEYEPLKGPPELTPEEEQLLRERGVDPLAYQMGILERSRPGGGEGLPIQQRPVEEQPSVGEIWSGLKAIPVAGVVPRTAEEIAQATMTGMMQPAYGLERGVGMAMLTGYGHRPLVPSLAEQHKRIGDKLAELDLTPREKLDLSRTAYTWLADPQSLEYALDDMKQGMTIDKAARKYQHLIPEAIGQIVLNPLNVAGAGLGKIRDVKLLHNVRAQYVTRAAPAVEQALDSAPWFKRAWQSAAGKVDDINPFRLTTKSKARALDRHINSFVGFVVNKADTPDDAKNLVRTFINNPDKLTAEFGSFVRSPVAGDVREALRKIDFDNLKSLKIETPEKAMQAVMAGMEAPATEFKVMDFLSELYDKSIRATNDLYNVQPATTPERWANEFKAFMADFYMGISPRASIRNAAGNTTFLAYDGLLSFASHSQIDDYMTRTFGFSPMQTQRGLGLAREYRGPQKGLPIIRDLAEKGRRVYQGTTPILGESWARYSGSYAAMRKFDNMYWKPGRGGLMDLSMFDDIWPKIDPSTKSNLIAAWRQSLNADELLANTDKALGGGRMVSKYLDDAEEVSPGFVSALQEAVDEATDVTGAVDKNALTRSVQDIQAEIDKRVVRSAEVDGITPKPVVMPETALPAGELRVRIDALKNRQNQIAKLTGAPDKAIARELAGYENELARLTAEVMPRAPTAPPPTVKPKEAALVPGIEYAEELRAGRGPEIAERMYSTMVREQAAWGASAEGFVLDAQELGRAAYELEMWEKGPWAKNAWAKYVSRDIPFPTKMSEMRRLMEAQPELVINWQDYLIRQMATRNTPSWQLLQDHPAVKDIVRMLPLDEVEQVVVARPSAKLELEELVGALPEIADPALPKDIGELAVHAGIDPMTAGYEEWEKVLGYANERYRYHELRMMPEGLDSIAAQEAKRLPKEGWAFGTWRRVRSGKMSAKQERIFRRNLIPADMKPKQFYKMNGDAAQAYFDLAEELEAMLGGIPRPVDAAADVPFSPITLAAGEAPTLPLKEGAYPTPRPEVWKIDVGRITPERLPTAPERVTPLLPEGAPPAAAPVPPPPPVAAAARPPWEMTGREYVRASTETFVSGLEQSAETAKKMPGASVDALRAEYEKYGLNVFKATGGPHRGKYIIQHPTGLESRLAVGKKALEDIPARLRSWARFARKTPDFVAGAPIAEHEALVARALSEGRAVPANVLADYPDLAKAAPGVAAAGLPEVPTPLRYGYRVATKDELQQILGAATPENIAEAHRIVSERAATVGKPRAAAAHLALSNMAQGKTPERNLMALEMALGPDEFQRLFGKAAEAAPVAGKVPGGLHALSNAELEAEIARLRAADDPALRDALKELQRRASALERDRFTAQRRAGELPGMPSLEMGARGVTRMEAPEAAARGEALLGRGAEELRKAQAEEIAARAPTLFEMPGEEVVTPAMKRTRVADLQDEISAITAEMQRKPAAARGMYEAQIAKRQAEVDRLLSEALPKAMTPAETAAQMDDAALEAHIATMRREIDKAALGREGAPGVQMFPTDEERALTAELEPYRLEMQSRVSKRETAARLAQERAAEAAKLARKRAETAERAKTIPAAATLDAIPYTQGIDPGELKRSEAGWRLRGGHGSYWVEGFDPEDWQWFEKTSGNYKEMNASYKASVANEALTETDLQRGLEKLRQSGMLAYSDGVESAAEAETNLLKRLLDEEAGAFRPGARRPEPVKYAPVSDELKATIRQRVQDSLVPARNDANMAKLQWAYEVVNRALYDYDKRYQIDRLLSLIFPFHFWPTRTGYQAAMRGLTKPWSLTAYYRTRKALEKINEEMGFPRRYGAAVKVPVPEAAEGVMPDWAEKSVMIDLAPYIFPHTGVWPFNYLSRVNWDDNDESKTALDRVADLEAIFSMSPHWPLSMAMDIARGKPEEVGYVLPQTGVLKGTTAALKAKYPDRFGWVPPGGINMEKPLRTGLGLPEAQGYEETYWSESMVLDMAANGEITPQERDALLNPGDPQYHQGDIWDEAVNRAAIFKQLPGAVSYMTGIRPGLVPKGEMKIREGAAEVGKIYEREEAGEKGPEIRAERSQWYRDNPWYTGRGLLWTPGPEREMDFRESEFYDARNAIYDKYATQLDEVQLGDWRARQVVYDARQKELDALDDEYPDVKITPSFWGYTASEVNTYHEDQALRPVADAYYAIAPENYADAEGNVDWDAFYTARDDFIDDLSKNVDPSQLFDIGLNDKMSRVGWLTRARFERYLRRNDDPKEALWKVYKDGVITPAQNKMYDIVEGLEDGADRQKVFDRYNALYGPRSATDFITRVLAMYPEKGWTYGELERAYTNITLPGLEEYGRLGDTPRERAVADLWDFYMALPGLDKKKFRKELGERFDKNFLNKKTRDYDAITDEELIHWLNYAGLDAGTLPEMTEAQGTASRVAEAHQIAEQAAIAPPVTPAEPFTPTPQFTPSDPALSKEYDQAAAEREEMWAQIEAQWPKYSDWADLYSKLESWQDDERKAMQAVLQPARDLMDEWRQAHPMMDKWLYSEPSDDPRKDAVSDLWNYYMALSTLDKRRLKEELGDRFTTYFVSKDSRNYDKISTDELMAWLGYVGLDSGLGAKIAEERQAAADAWVASGKQPIEPQPEVAPTLAPTKAATLTAAAGQSDVASAVAGLFSPSAPTTSADYDQALTERGQMWDVINAAWPSYSQLMDAYNALKWWQFDERAALKAQLEPVWDFTDSWKASHPTMVKWLYPTWQPYVPKAKAEPKKAAPKAKKGKAPTKQQILEGTAQDWVDFAKTVPNKQLLELIQGYLLLTPLQRNAYLARFPELAEWLLDKDAEWLAKLAESLGAHLAATEPRKQYVRRPPTLRWYQRYS